jgi:hypothetical protein
METLTHQVPESGAIAAAHKFPEVQNISVEYDQKNDRVIVTPGKVHKGDTVCFKDPKGSKLRIVFLSPSGKETDAMLDSEACAMTIGGSYHFKCFFTLPGATSEISPATGGILDVVPHRP